MASPNEIEPFTSWNNPQTYTSNPFGVMPRTLPSKIGTHDRSVAPVPVVRSRAIFVRDLVRLIGVGDVDLNNDQVRLIV